ncbi:MAG TPA: 3-isopropylmalate dehydrogenase [Actinospica sp.]|nr:3-isopropylmalate dehydrogenase [Actinospica sp.]
MPSDTEVRSKLIDLAVIGGDGIGPEVTAEALKVLAAVLPEDVKLETTEYKLGAEHWLATGEALSEETLEKLKAHDAILFGAVGAAPGDKRIPSGLIERGMLLKLRFAFDHYVNLRPSKLWPGTTGPLRSRAERSPNDGGSGSSDDTVPVEPMIDFIVVREGTEGPYAGNGGTMRAGTDQEIATEVSVNTAYGIERVVRDAFERAKARPRRKLTLVHKNNVLVFAGHLWTRIFNAVATEYPEVTTDYMHVDAATIFLSTQPERFDVIVTDNLFGDILTDLAAAVTGGIGLAASGNVNPARTFPSMFEPVHGSAPDIAGTGKADPTAAILSAALLLAHLGHPEAAARIESAVGADLIEREGGAARSTSEIGDAIRVRVAG